jgi:hypothetical protein
MRAGHFAGDAAPLFLAGLTRAACDFDHRQRAGRKESRTVLLIS